MNVPKAKWILRGAGCLVLLTTAFIFWPFRFSYNAVCTKCGAEQYVQDWQFPGTHWTIFSRSSEIATPLSKSSSSSGLVGAHAHTWLLAAGGGNGIKCAIGGGRHLWTIIRQPKSGQLLEAIQRYDGKEDAQSFLKLALDPNHSEDDALMMVMFFPTNGLSSREQFQAWLSENDLHLGDIMSGAGTNLLGRTL